MRVSRENILFSFMVTLLLSCGTTNEVAYDPLAHSDVEIFSKNGGRVDWNASTNKIAMDQENEGRWDLFLCNPDKSEMINLTFNMTGKKFGDQTVRSWQHRGQPAFSPSGEYIAFQVMNEHASESPKTNELLSLGVNNDLWIMKADGTNIQKLTNNPAGFAVLHAHFSHDGKKILWSERYGSDKSASNFGEWRMMIAEILIETNGHIELVNIKSLQPGGPKFYETHAFSEDDTKIYFSGNLTTDMKANDIYEYNLSNQQLKNITQQKTSWQEMYNVNPKNKSMYSYISSSFFDWNNKWGWATLRTELYIRDGAVEKQLTYFNQKGKSKGVELSKIHYLIGDHCWSPDGEYLLAVLAGASVGTTSSRIIKIKVN